MTTPTQQPTQKTLTPPSRMRLDKLVKGKQQQRIRALISGVEGVGKSTFGAGAPRPIFLGAEDGTAQLDVTRFPQPERWEEVLETVRVLTQESHDFETLVVDTIDWIEPMIWRYVCARDDQKDIEAYGYGKGYQVALDEWRRLFAALDRLRAARPMHVLLLAHSWIKPYKNPLGDDYDRFELKLHNKAAGLAKEWCDAVLFANWETYAKKDERTKRVRGISTGARILFTERTAGWDAKNRYSLPAELPLSWSDFESAVAAGAVAPASDLKAEILRKAKELGIEDKVIPTLEQAKDNPQSLALINNKLNARIAEKASAQTPAPSAEKAG